MISPSWSMLTQWNACIKRGSVPPKTNKLLRVAGKTKIMFILTHRGQFLHKARMGMNAESDILREKLHRGRYNVVVILQTTFLLIFLYENCCICIRISQKFGLVCPIDNISESMKGNSYMMTSSNGNIFRVTGHLCGNPPPPPPPPHKGQWRGALMFSLICVWINDWVTNREAGDLRRYRAHYDVSVINFVVITVPAGGLALWDAWASAGTVMTNIYTGPTLQGLKMCWGIRCHFRLYICMIARHETESWHIKAETKWPPFSRRHFQIHFIEWKCMNFG